MTWAYNFSFSATNGPLSWIVPAEIFDTRTRSKGVSIATMTSFAFKYVCSILCVHLRRRYETNFRSQSPRLLIYADPEAAL